MVLAFMVSGISNDGFAWLVAWLVLANLVDDAAEMLAIT
jgi:hypothetical protein